MSKLAGLFLVMMGVGAGILALSLRKEAPPQQQPQESPCNKTAFLAAWDAKRGDAAYNPIFDFNGDGVIDIGDAVLFDQNCCGFDNFVQFAASYPSRRGDPNYVEKWDLNSDGVIDESDWALYQQFCG